MAKIAIMGAGGIGAVYGARLAEAGHEVAWIARGEHLAALQKAGLKLQSPAGDAHLPGLAASADPAEIGVSDLVLHTTKMTALAEDPGFVAPLVGEGTAVVCLQNGVEAPEMLAAALGADHVLGGLAYISAHIVAPGVVEQVGAFTRIEFGAPDAAARPLEAKVEDWLTVPGIETTLVPDIRLALWRKFGMLASGAAMMSAARTTYGALREDPAGRQMFLDALGEAAAVARAEGVALPDDYADWAMGVVDGFPAEMTASMRVDLERGKPMELPWFSGTIARLGEKHGVPTPVHRHLEIVLRLQQEAAG
jgi:2-dehydropantoate 2-reductase